MNRVRAFSQFEFDQEKAEQAAIASAFFAQLDGLPGSETFEYLRSDADRLPARHEYSRFSIVGEKGNWDASMMEEVLKTLGPNNDAGRRLLSGKRLFDIAGSFAALFFLAPIFLMVCLLIWLTSSGPVFYAHERIGKHGQIFRCLKFRTMRRDADEALAAHLQANPDARCQWDAVHKLTHDPRISPLGRFLRLSSIDELPQLLNVIAGDMSLVGPRPIVSDECGRYGRYLQRYLQIQPGLTGLWQVSGRNRVTYRRRVALDVLYSRRATFALDLWILLKTIPTIAKTEGY